MDQIDLHNLQEATVWDVNDSKLGVVGQVHLNPITGQPEWVSVPMGLLESRGRFIPLLGAYVSPGTKVPDLHVNYEREFIQDSPDIDPNVGLTPEHEDQLRTYYGLETPAG